MSKPLLVLDTNVVLDLLHFEDPIVHPLRQALEAGQVHCVASPSTLEELQRVLAYPEFSLAPARQSALLAAYQGLSTVEEVRGASAGLPICSDPDDQKFLELAAATCAQGLVSKDRALLKLRRRCVPHFRIMTPAEAVCWLKDELA